MDTEFEGRERDILLHRSRNRRLAGSKLFVLGKRKVDGRKRCGLIRRSKPKRGGDAWVFWLQSKRNASIMCIGGVWFVVGVIYILLPRPESSF